MHNIELGPVEQFKAISDYTKHFFKKQIVTWFGQNRRHFPWRETKDPYRILVAEILLQQTDAAKVSLIYSAFLQRYPSASALAEAPSDKVHELIFKIGLHYRTERLVNIAKDIKARFGGQIPCSESELLTLLGVGRYIANAVLVASFGMRKATVDTNIVRILERFFGIYSHRSRPRTDPELWAVAGSLLPRKASDCRNWNYALVDFGALVCTHYNPKCSVCVCNRKCVYVSTR
jgi:A/G-specific adenine glycosylase